MNKIVVTIILAIICITIVKYGIKKKLVDPVSFDEKANTLVYSSIDTSGSNIFWTARTLTLISDKGKLREVQVGLATNGNFVWRDANKRENEFHY